MAAPSWVSIRRSQDHPTRMNLNCGISFDWKIVGLNGKNRQSSHPMAVKWSPSDISKTIPPAISAIISILINCANWLDSFIKESAPKPLAIRKEGLVLLAAFKIFVTNWGNRLGSCRPTISSSFKTRIWLPVKLLQIEMVCWCRNQLVDCPISRDLRFRTASRKINKPFIIRISSFKWLSRF